MKKLFKTLIGIVGVCFVLAWISPAAAVEIGVAWAGKSGMSNRVAKGFEKGMAEKAPDIKIEYQKELASVDDLAKVATQWDKTKTGMVLIRSNAAKWLAKNPPHIPTFIGGCNNPEQLGAVKDMKAPEGMITGVTYFLPVEKQFEIFKAILPNMKSVLLLLEDGNASTLIDQKETKAVTEKLGIAYNEVIAKSPQDLLAAVESYKGKVSAIIVGNVALAIDNTKAVVEAAGATPVLSYSSKPVNSGALGGFSADDEKLGYMLAESVVAILKNGKAVKDVPVKVDPDPKFYVNAKTADKTGVQIPYTILEAATIIE